MTRIRVLDADTVSRIAAGEVVERPAAVVKELVENALDAGARVVHIDIAAGGLERITVTDDGCGMEPDDAELALQRHATSKIAAADDLETVRTLGFRGEALPSIAAVSRLTLRTRPAASPAGTVLETEGGLVLSKGVTGGPPGTAVTVRDLFFNTPARRKFVRSAAHEGGIISEMVGRLALSRPEVAFHLIGNGRQVLATSGSGDLLDAVGAVFGAAVAREMVPVRFEERGLGVSGYVGRPGVSRSSRRHQVFFVNGRYIRSAYLGAAAEEALHGTLPAGRHAVLVLHLSVEPGMVDVNVHPAKHEVRFSRPRDVYVVVHRAVREALRREIQIPVGEYGHLESACFPGAGTGFRMPVQVTFQGGEPELREESTGYQGFPQLQPLGFLPPAYILAGGADGLYILDQHAAHERVLFEQYLRTLEQSAGKQLLVPVMVEIRGREAQTLEDYGPFLRQAGFEVDPFGEGAYLIRTVPSFLRPGAEAALLTDVLDRLAGERPVDADAFRRVVAAVLACHRAVRGGDKPAGPEAAALLTDLGRCAEPYLCPHGRPTLIRIGFPELARRFQRE
ncbi:MAG: DNA mismatch repair endonuclease MutL [Bacillota bacterium]